MEQTFVLLSLFTISVQPAATYQRNADSDVSEYRDGLSVFGLQRPKKLFITPAGCARTIMESIRLYLVHSGWEKESWFNAVSTRAFIG